MEEIKTPLLENTRSMKTYTYLLGENTFNIDETGLQVLFHGSRLNHLWGNPGG